jgi:hypothetical protein
VNLEQQLAHPARPLVVYHADRCADGFTAAWVANKRLRLHSQKPEFFPTNYGEPIPPEVDGRMVYVLDFSYDPEPMREIINRADFTVVLDHHKTAKDKLQPFLGLQPKSNVIFDMEKSGARLAWEYFFDDEKVPKLIEYTEDRDLWRWKLPYSREVSAYVKSQPHTFEAWEMMHLRLEPDRDGPHDIMVRGAAVLDFQTRLVEQMVDAAIKTTYKDAEGNEHDVWTAQAPVLWSEVGHELAKRGPFGVCWRVVPPDLIKYDLRSEEGGADVSEIAKAMGGGGHKHAAGYTVKSYSANCHVPLTLESPLSGVRRLEKDVRVNREFARLKDLPADERMLALKALAVEDYNLAVRVKERLTKFVSGEGT